VERLCEQKLRSKAGLVRLNASGQLLPVHSEGYIDLIGLLQAILNHLIWHPIGSQRSHLLYQLNWGVDMALIGELLLRYNYSDLTVLKLSK
jgi:hypothetical protein